MPQEIKLLKILENRDPIRRPKYNTSDYLPITEG
jgi:hypothetical protein